MKEYSIFDIIGPNMIGPSSSHTAGACRIGNVARKIAGKDIKKASFLLHGSFAKTYQGHGTDRALLGGILGFDTDDDRIRNSFEIAKARGIEFEFEETDLGEVHANTVKIIIDKHDKSQVQVLGSSIGGGNIIISEINGLELEFTGEYTTIIISHKDKPGVIAGVTKILAEYLINIAFMRVYRHGKGQRAFMIIETDDDINSKVIEDIEEIKDVANTYLVAIRN